ncbi:Atg14 domain-containing protein [Bacillus sonorensis]|uniref:hypothetical protein n=1 Tax=Bacillus sonorensis TaxID=119858 RepID=UPI00228087BC|nr:hypothetical protein [Bacillus sonorensis]MCY8026386.1 Atg14 domain-containing protein [Bacillus sonorensis]
MIDVHCDSCSNPFYIRLQEQSHIKGVIETFFVCPHCGKRTTAAVTNHEVRKKIDELKTLRSEIGRADSEKEIDILRLKVEKLKAEIDEKMADLKQRYGKR